MMMKRTAKGFTLVELIIVIALIGIAMLIGIPALQNYLNRAKVEGSMRSTMLTFRTARYEAIKRSQTVTVQGHLTDGWIDSYIDVDQDLAFTAGDIQVQPRFLVDYPVTFQEPGGGQPTTFAVNAGTFLVGFQNDGSVTQSGVIQMGDQRGNFIQIEIDPAATAKMSRSKWYQPQNDWLEWGQEGVAWKWY